MRRLLFSVLVLVGLARLPPAAQAATPPYWVASAQCPANRPWLIGYARFTHAPVCGNVCRAGVRCWDATGATYVSNQTWAPAPPRTPRAKPPR